MINSLKNINFRSTVTEFTETNDYRFQNHFIFISIHVIKVLRFLNFLQAAHRKKNSHFNCFMIFLKPADSCTIYCSLKFNFVVQNTPQVLLEIITRQSFINTSILVEDALLGGHTGTDQPSPECFLQIIFARIFGKIVVVVRRNHRFGYLSCSPEGVYEHQYNTYRDNAS